MSKVLFSQLWTEEEAYLLEAASEVKDAGLIVEIGTAQGGSSSVFSEGAKGKGIEIYSYDVSPSKEAYINLKRTGVKIIAKSSSEGARSWDKTCGEPIDLLFIDGSHTLLNVIDDFNNWAPLMRRGGRLIFHDYDPVQKGGYPHLGVKVAVEAVIASGALIDRLHIGRMLSGTVMKNKLPVHFDSCLDVWKRIGDGIDGIIKKKPKDIKNLMRFDDLKVYYLFYWALDNMPDELLSHVKDRKKYFKFQEQLEMLDDFSGTQTIKDIFEDKAIRDIGGLSAVISREIVRLNLLAEIKTSMQNKAKIR